MKRDLKQVLKLCKELLLLHKCSILFYAFHIKAYIDSIALIIPKRGHTP